MKFSADPRKDTSLGSVEVVVLGVVFLVIIFALGFFNDSVPVFNGVKYFPISITPQPSQSTLQMQTMQFISIVQTPTPTPTPTPPGNPTPTLPAGTPTPTSGSSTPTTTPPPASLLCGTNLYLGDDNDFINNNGVHSSLAKLHVSTLRIPLRTDKDPTGARLVKSVQIAHSLGVIPLVTLPSETTYLALDINVIQQINAIMGGSQIYYELGNEVFDNNYLGKWNTIIHQLKPLAGTNAWFGGPAAASNAHGQTANMAQFYVSANPKPDFLSWHEYTCDLTTSGKNNTTYCLTHIDTAPNQNWGQHILDTKSNLQSLGVNQMPPIFITEWNHISSGPGTGTEPLVQQLAQMHFNTRALTELKNIGIYAAYQYALSTNPDYNLTNWNGSTITLPGQDFQSFCQNP